MCSVFNSSLSHYDRSKKASKQIIVRKLSTVDVCSNLKDNEVLSSYSPSSEIISPYPFTSSSASTLTTTTSSRSLTKGRLRLTFEDCQKDIESGFITVPLHDSAPSEEDITSSDSHLPTHPQFPAAYQSRFIEGSMSSSSINRSHHSLRPTSSIHVLNEDEDAV